MEILIRIFDSIPGIGTIQQIPKRCRYRLVEENYPHVHIQVYRRKENRMIQHNMRSFFRDHLRLTPVVKHSHYCHRS